MAIVQNGDLMRAARVLDPVNLAIVKAAALRLQKTDCGRGARPVGSLAAGPVHLVSLTRPKAGGKTEAVTPIGYRTAKRADPRFVRDLAEDDPRKQVVAFLADAVERVGSVGGRDPAGSDSKSVFSDGGATTRVKHAARLRVIEAAANGWSIDRQHGPVRSAPRVALAPRRRGGARQAIKAFPALVAVCVDGKSLDQILREHGWSAQAFNRSPLKVALLQALADVAEALGLGAVASDGAP